ncbi:hypothetical protein [Chryseobacterium balustinum]|uniref:Uncharacterized protein n=1 Tax=Chryseobacterium balustinum TaxID=246 RepID=A0AAX2IMI0_9FLAO|nr:hypothetical protein [Chryseobacterium balustinum]AZB30153.1 hypothetical protein EB354_13315 [Chryseobacterium balustinum]SKB65144.1 hypothetical protein SAMN05421800_10571 [Chryseobacterium balustinum]SQA90780.1 Uncharacterised protein [Chryseobacterium balustinum]
MAVFAIPNPKKTIQVDFPLEKIKNSILNIPLLNKNYRFSSSNEIFNQFTFESFEFLSIGVYLDFHLNSISENKTEINLEIRRKIGSFNQPAEITNANIHIDKLFKYVAQLTSMSDDDITLLKQRTVIQPPVKKNGGCLKIGLIILACIVGCFFIFGIIGMLMHHDKSDNNQTKENTYKIQSDTLFAINLNKGLDYEDGDYTVKYEQLSKDLNSTYAIRTKDYDFQFRNGMKELHVIPILENGKTNSEKRKIYDTKFGGVIPRHLTFALKNSKNQKGIFDVQFDSKTNPDKVVIVKFISGDIDFCKRGVVYNVMNQRRDEF